MPRAISRGVMLALQPSGNRRVDRQHGQHNGGNDQPGFGPHALLQVGHHAERHGERAAYHRGLPIPIGVQAVTVVLQHLEELCRRVLALRRIGAQEIDRGLLALMVQPYRPEGEGKPDQREDQPPELEPVVVHDVAPCTGGTRGPLWSICRRPCSRMQPRGISPHIPHRIGEAGSARDFSLSAFPSAAIDKYADLAYSPSTLPPINRKETMMAKQKDQRTLVTFLLDETGSMASIKDDTIGGFNSYLETLKTSGTPIDFTLIK